MGLLKKLFGGKEKEKDAAASSMPASQFNESLLPAEPGSARNGAPRRDLVQVVLRDTMREHGIPSDWIDCRILSVASRKRGTGMHVQLVVRQGHDNLLPYVYPFQESFVREVEKFDARAREWLLSVAWQFEGTGTLASAMPDPSVWGDSQIAPEKQAPAEDDVEADLKALFAIRDAALKDEPLDPVDFQPTQPGFVDSGTPRR